MTESKRTGFPFHLFDKAALEERQRLRLAGELNWPLSRGRRRPRRKQRSDITPADSIGAPVGDAAAIIDSPKLNL